jgi:hypothetical protein
MGTRPDADGYTSIGAIGELMFAAEARSRGHIVFFPIGEAISGTDVVMVSKSKRKYTVQIKTQCTAGMRSVDLRVGPRSNGKRKVDADIVALFWNGDWYLVPRSSYASRSKTMRVSKIKKHKGWGCVR